MFAKKSIQSYLKKLSSNEPIPGGGSVSAFSAALGVGLLLMVVNFTIGKKVYKAYSKELLVLLKRLNSLEQKLTRLISEDSKTYLLVAKAYKLPKLTSKQEALRKRKIQQALKKSAMVTFDILLHGMDALRLSKRLLTIGNKNLISDVGVGAVMLDSAVKGAVINIDINLAGIKDKRFIDRLDKKTKGLTKEAKKLAHYVLSETSRRIGKK